MLGDFSRHGKGPLYDRLRKRFQRNSNKRTQIKSINLITNVCQMGFCYAQRPHNAYKIIAIILFCFDFLGCNRNSQRTTVPKESWKKNSGTWKGSISNDTFDDFVLANRFTHSALLREHKDSLHLTKRVKYKHWFLSISKREIMFLLIIYG